MSRDKKNKPTVRERFADAVDISKDVMLGLPVVTMLGNRELTIENYVGILEYGEEEIRIKCRAVSVLIEGTGLELKTMTDDFLYITGRFKCFSYE
ncbi:MAG TPA: YabP/YqfC family sporulation protein [Candidatus Monoglobus merdigallinarum]|uniref:YabP/YqfC family sporulation protein n=1 Tax=Candidatus Monoglobus merdigallinarum TaxID=2838698 RepID=A0A9D1PSW0_9FIRM|nr:YabP/YqfC family sporulation protein [Candidatus Monoglobus merdigallinarum]